jgi:hypothetical protein
MAGDLPFQTRFLPSTPRDFPSRHHVSVALAHCKQITNQIKNKNNNKQTNKIIKLKINKCSRNDLPTGKDVDEFFQTLTDQTGE